MLQVAPILILVFSTLCTAPLAVEAQPAGKVYRTGRQAFLEGVAGLEVIQ